MSEKRLPNLRPGVVAHFLHLHLQTLKMCDRRPANPQHYLCEVEGKARPGIVYAGPCDGYGGKIWYQVFPLTTTSGGPRTRHIGPCIDSRRDSYIYVDPVWYPENLRSGENQFELPRMDFDNICRIVGYDLLRTSSR